MISHSFLGCIIASHLLHFIEKLLKHALEIPSFTKKRLLRIICNSVSMKVLMYLFSGHGDSSSQKTPKLVHGIGLVSQVATGSSHTIVLSKDGLTVWTFGAGDNGMYGSFITIFFVLLRSLIFMQEIDMSLCLMLVVFMLRKKIFLIPVYSGI